MKFVVDCFCINFYTKGTIWIFKFSPSIALWSCVLELQNCRTQTPCIFQLFRIYLISLNHLLKNLCISFLYKSVSEFLLKQPFDNVYPGQRLCVNCYITSRNLSVQREENDLVLQSSSSEFDDVNTGLHNIFSSDASFDSPSKPLRISQSVTSAIQVTPVQLDLKKSKELRLVTIKKTA
jgi:hypothetical protein